MRVKYSSFDRPPKLLISFEFNPPATHTLVVHSQRYNYQINIFLLTTSGGLYRYLNIPVTQFIQISIINIYTYKLSPTLSNAQPPPKQSPWDVHVFTSMSGSSLESHSGRCKCPVPIRLALPLGTILHWRTPRNISTGSQAGVPRWVVDNGSWRGRPVDAHRTVDPQAGAVGARNGTTARRAVSLESSWAPVLPIRERTVVVHQTIRGLSADASRAK